VQRRETGRTANLPLQRILLRRRRVRGNVNPAQIV